MADEHDSWLPSGSDMADRLGGDAARAEEAADRPVSCSCGTFYLDACRARIDGSDFLHTVNHCPEKKWVTDEVPEEGVPERVFLQTGTDKREGYEGVEWSEVSWWRERIYESDIEYVRVHRRRRPPSPQ